MTILEVKNLAFEVKNNLWKKNPILHNINLQVQEAEIFAFIGPNGAGKSTTIRSILGLQRATKGEVHFFQNQDITSAQDKIGYAPDEAIFYEYLSGLEHLIHFAGLSNINPSIAQQKWIELLSLVGLDHANNTKVKDYSKGMKQRLGLAISLIKDPQLLFWDEPMNGLDPIGRKHIKDLMKQLQKQWKTIFFSTHILSDVEEIASRFALIHKWEILASNTPHEIDSSLEDFFIQNTFSEKVNP